MEEKLNETPRLWASSQYIVIRTRARPEVAPNGGNPKGAIWSHRLKGLGRQPFKLEMLGSNPTGTTMVDTPLKTVSVKESTDYY